MAKSGDISRLTRFVACGPGRGNLDSRHDDPLPRKMERLPGLSRNGELLRLSSRPRPDPSGLAAGTPRRQAQVSASLPVTTAVISAAAPRPGPEAAAWLTAATWMSSVRISVTVPNGPMSERRMMSSATGAG